jgi:protein SERAC1
MNILMQKSNIKENVRQFGDALFLLNLELPLQIHLDNTGLMISKITRDDCNGDRCSEDSEPEAGTSVNVESAPKTAAVMDVVFVHDLRGEKFYLYLCFAIHACLRDFYCTYNITQHP